MKKAFTLIELLVVIAIISLLVSILMPSLAKAKLLAKRAACMAGMHSIGTGALMYSGDYAEEIPIAYRNFTGYANNWNCWRTNLLPYVGTYQVFNCPAADDTGTTIFHNDSEVTSTSLAAGTAAYGTIGIIVETAVSLYHEPDCFGQQNVSWANPMSCNSFSLIPGRAYRDPNNSVYCADGYALGKKPGTSMIYLPDPDPYVPATYNRCFADRHLGTDCLFLDGRVENFPKQVLDSMKYGASDCVWDVN